MVNPEKHFVGPDDGIFFFHRGKPDWGVARSVGSVIKWNWPINGISSLWATRKKHSTDPGGIQKFSRTKVHARGKNREEGLRSNASDRGHSVSCRSHW